MRTCLIIDDSDVIRKVAKRIAEDLRFVPLEAETGQAALEQCRRDMPDVILVDWHMPVMNGLDFLMALQAEHPEKNPVVIYCSTEHDTQVLSRALNAGATDFILKPYDKASIEEKFRETGLI